MNKYHFIINGYIAHTVETATHKAAVEMFAEFYGIPNVLIEQHVLHNDELAEMSHWENCLTLALLQNENA